MARTEIPVNVISRTALTAVPAEVTADVVNGNVYANGPATWMQVRNAHATLARNLTIRVPISVDGAREYWLKVYAVPANVTREVGPFPADVFGSTVEVDGETTDIKLTLRRTRA